MKVTATRPTYVETSGGKTLLQKNESAEVDGRRYRGHAFIDAGYLVAEEEPKPGRKQRQPEPTEESGQAGEE